MVGSDWAQGIDIRQSLYTSIRTVGSISGILRRFRGVVFPDVINYVRVLHAASSDSSLQVEIYSPLVAQCQCHLAQRVPDVSGA